MSLRCQASLILLVACAGRLVVPAVVLPRPPSSPNYIPESTSGGNGNGGGSSQEQDRQSSSDPGKLNYNEKALYGSSSGGSTNVEKPDIPDYRYLEIELRDAENVDSIDLHGLVQAVLDAHQPQSQQQQQQQTLPTEETTEDESNQTLPHPIVVPHSILGVRDVGLGLPGAQRLFEPVVRQHHHFSVYETAASSGLEGSTKNFNDEKLYYLKSGRPKVYVNFRGKSGNFRQDLGDSRVTVRIEPAAFLRATQSYHMEKKTKAPKKYDARLHGSSAATATDQRVISSGGSPTSTTTSTTTASTTTSSTTENAMTTSSELPKQIPAPPSRVPSLLPIAHTTPVQRYTLRRSDILPGYAFPE
ncbi:uncharacterized protein LOC106659900 [Trichogramma pretiosum]|uniref:uncharacterized protein LOC106659900 n=1 Tax=Trichogramma pretiosum TaxID=7493 RepID=UPI0006C9DFC5|nr:uncharacterized protein LOC106659900 [Trichogramma pretiosum]